MEGCQVEHAGAGPPSRSVRLAFQLLEAAPLGWGEFDGEPGRRRMERLGCRRERRLPIGVGTSVQNPTKREYSECDAQECHNEPCREFASGPSPNTTSSAVPP